MKKEIISLLNSTGSEKKGGEGRRKKDEKSSFHLQK